MKKILDSNKKEQYIVQSVVAAMQLLEEVAENPWQSVSSLAKAKKMTKSQAFRLLTTLEHLGYVIKEGQAYRLGYRGLYIGHLAERSMPIVALSRDVLDWLMTESQESVHLVERRGDVRFIVDMRESPQPLRTFAPIGQIDPLTVGGTGMVILAYSDPTFIERILSQPLKKVTPKTLVDPERIRQILRRIRAEGVYTAREDFDPGAFSVAAPIHNPDGSVTSAICVSGPLSRLDASQEEKHKELVLKAAQIISDRLRRNTQTTPLREAAPSLG
ncbi:MAG: IclR family transcriptional regulator [Meiothermus silvanus]|nr:IclR family transcriptional regulator [Allomeiothermus silvanus]